MSVDQFTFPPAVVKSLQSAWRVQLSPELVARLEGAAREVISVRSSSKPSRPAEQPASSRKEVKAGHKRHEAIVETAEQLVQLLQSDSLERLSLAKKTTHYNRLLALYLEERIAKAVPLLKDIVQQGVGVCFVGADQLPTPPHDYSESGAGERRSWPISSSSSRICSAILSRSASIAMRETSLPGPSPIALKAAVIALSFPCRWPRLARQCSLSRSMHDHRGSGLALQVGSAAPVSDRERASHQRSCFSDP